ncbi:MAG TPA: tyrosine-type recombinase/integrase [Fimbriimonadaceae bacterium]|nr:tyrosine-type recombinase/integrase [Fimbriimonadaceae bacterium]
MGTRADNGDGSCRQVKSGKHAGRWRVQFTYKEGYRKERLSRLFRYKADAKAFLFELRHGARVEKANERRELTLGKWFDWLAENDWAVNLDAKTIASRQGRFNKHVRRCFGDTPLALINPLHVRDFYHDLKESGVGEATVHSIKANLVRVFNQAISPYNQVLSSIPNPFRLELQGSTPREAIALTPDEAAAALKCAALTISERAMLATFLLTGLRLSEFMALTRGQLLMDQSLIAVDRAVKLDKVGGQTVGLPKGNKKRLAVMCPTLKTILCEFVGDPDADRYLWSAERINKPLHKSVVYRAWKEILTKTGLPPSMSPHDCRLTHINWIEKLLPEVSSTTLKEHVGHAGVGVTEINYTRPLTPAQDILRCGLDRLIARPIDATQAA